MSLKPWLLQLVTYITVPKPWVLPMPCRVTCQPFFFMFGMGLMRLLRQALNLQPSYFRILSSRIGWLTLIITWLDLGSLLKHTLGYVQERSQTEEKGERELSSNICFSLHSDYKFYVTNCLMFLPPCLLCHKGPHPQVVSRNIPFPH